YRTDHAGMTGATEFSTVEIEAPGLRRFEPDRTIPARHHIHLDAKSRHEETVEHIFRRHRQLDAAAYGDVQFIDFALAFEVLKFPHPLFGDDVDIHRIGGRAIDFEV